MILAYAATLGVAFASALIPVVNIEAYLVVVADGGAGQIALAVLAAAGQMLGKTLWYVGGAQSTRLPFIQRRLAKPKAAARLEKWQQRAEGRPVLTGTLLFASAFTGFPPYAVMCSLAGVLRVHVAVFVITGFAGRLLRFWLVIVGAVEVARLL